MEMKKHFQTELKFLAVFLHSSSKTIYRFPLWQVQNYCLLNDSQDDQVPAPSWDYACSKWQLQKCSLERDRECQTTDQYSEKLQDVTFSFVYLVQ